MALLCDHAICKILNEMEKKLKMSNVTIEKEIVEIIKNFRQSSIELKINQEHVHKWISQFTFDTQDIILEETLHILKNWYFDKDKIRLFLGEMIDFLRSENENATDREPLKDICFLDIQENGKSQSQLLGMLSDEVREKYKCDVKIGNPNEEKFYVYLDDGLYTGSRLRKDIKSCLKTIPEGARIDAFFLIACSSGMDYSKKVLEKECGDKDIEFNIQRWREIRNNKTIENDGTRFSHEAVHDCLWPSSKLYEVPIINSYVEELEHLYRKRIYYCFRNADYRYTEGIFKSLKNRDVVEEEFLKKGIEITKNIREHKGLYPLGYNLIPSLGFGSFCATDLNISNTCPIVLWWGNIIKQGDELDCWYPLLPRRINDKDIKLFDAELKR